MGDSYDGLCLTPTFPVRRGTEDDGRGLSLAYDPPDTSPLIDQ